MSRPEHDDLTTQLTRSLTDRADTMSGSSLGLAEITGRARSIRRRRTATAVVGAAAVVAVLVPTAALARHSGGSPEPAPATQATPSTQTQTQTAKTIDAGAVLDVSELPAGAPPRLGYELDGTYHQPDGGTSDVGTTAPVERMAVLADGTVVYLTRDQGDAGSTQIQIATPGVAVSAPMEAGDGLAVNTRRNLAVWMSRDGRVEGYAVDGTNLGSFLLKGKVSGDSAQVLAVAGDDCGAGGTCRVLVRSTDPQTGENVYWVVTPGGHVEQLTAAGFRSWSDLATDGTRVGLTRVRTDGSTCSGVAAAGRPPAFRTCDHQLVSLSPSGEDVSAIADQTDGAGSSDLAAYDVGGQLLFDHASDPSKPARQATVQTLVWEDDTHLLATVYQQGEWSVVRFGLDGSMEVAVAGVAGDVAFSPIVLPGERS